MLFFYPDDLKMKTFLISMFGVVTALILSACGGGSDSTSGDGTTGYQWKLPDDFPTPRVPDENPMSTAKVELGRLLFYDRRMSINETKSCGDCHEQRRGFTDNLETAVGVTVTELHPRNSLSLTNVAYNSVFNWANPNFTTLESQASGVLFNETPVELGWADNEETILERFRSDVIYQQKFTDAFPDDDAPINAENVTRAIASFERTLISGNSDFDRFNRGDKAAMSESARRGMELFFSERLECFHCHGGFNLSQTVDHEGITFQQIEFHNNALYNLDGKGSYPSNNTGLWEFTQKDSDMGRFRPPTLRNIALTAPYMHDGSMATLESVLVDNYARGGRLITSGPNAGDGALNPYRSSLIFGFLLSAQDTTDVLAFFDALTDWDFVCNPELSDPFGNIPMHTNCP
jgi:cytochrome c peroxidase